MKFPKIKNALKKVAKLGAKITAAAGSAFGGSALATPLANIITTASFSVMRNHIIGGATGFLLEKALFYPALGLVQVSTGITLPITSAYFTYVYLPKLLEFAAKAGKEVNAAIFKLLKDNGIDSNKYKQKVNILEPGTTPITLPYGNVALDKDGNQLAIKYTEAWHAKNKKQGPVVSSLDEVTDLKKGVIVLPKKKAITTLKNSKEQFKLPAKAEEIITNKVKKANINNKKLTQSLLLTY